MLIWNLIKSVPNMSPLKLAILGTFIVILVSTLHIIVPGGTNVVSIKPKPESTKESIYYPINGKFYDRIIMYETPKTIDGVVMMADPYISPFMNKVTPEESEEHVQQFMLAVKRDSSISNIRRMPRNWFMYEIENGTVVCREHAVWNAITCWKK